MGLLIICFHGRAFKRKGCLAYTHVDLEHVQFWEEKLVGGGYSGWLAGRESIETYVKWYSI